MKTRLRHKNDIAPFQTLLTTFIKRCIKVLTELNTLKNNKKPPGYIPSMWQFLTLTVKT